MKSCFHTNCSDYDYTMIKKKLIKNENKYEAS